MLRMSEHETQDSYLERTSFPLFHPKKSKLLRSGFGSNERAKKLDRYGGTHIEILEDEGHKSGNSQKEADSVPVMVEEDERHQVLTETSNMNPYLINPLVSMGFHQLPHLAMLVHQHQNQHVQAGQENANLASSSTILNHPFLFPPHLLSGNPSLLSGVEKSWSDYSSERNSSYNVGSNAVSGTIMNSTNNSTNSMPSSLVDRQAGSALQKEENSSNKHPFVCEICKQWFFSKEKLLMHMVMNHGMHNCQFCSDLFSTSELRDEHVSNTHLPLECDMCQINSPSAHALAEHYLTNHDVYSCVFCGVLVRPKSYYSVHIRRKHFVANVDEFMEKENVKIIQSWDSENGSAWTFTCHLCGKERKRAETFGHFFSYHRLSLACLIQLLAAEGIKVSIQGTPAPSSSGNSVDDYSKSSPSHSSGPSTNDDELRTCTICTNAYSVQVPKSAHDLFCQGLTLCHFCDKTFTSKSARNSHSQIEHGKLKCRLGCSDHSFIQESELAVHYHEEHNLRMCNYCRTLVPSHRGLLEEHLRREHSCSSDSLALEQYSVGTGTDLFLCKNVNSDLFVSCSLCNEDITSLVKDINLVFKHLQFHKITLQSSLELLETNLIFDTEGCSKVKKENKGKRKDERKKTNSESPTLSGKENVILPRTRRSRYNLQNSAEIKQENESKSKKDSVEENASNDVSKSQQKPCSAESEESDGSTNDECEHGKTVKNNQKPKKKCYNKRSKERVSETSSESSDDEGPSEGEGADNEDFSDDDDDDDDDDGEMTTGDEKPKTNIISLNNFVAAAEFDPNEIECICTDTSEDECNDDDVKKLLTSIELEIKKEVDVDEQNQNTEELENHSSNGTLHDTMREMFGDLPRVKSEQVLQECDMCAAQFAELHDLAQHMVEVHGFNKISDKQYCCAAEGCDESYNSKTLLVRHRAQVHSDTTGDFRCPCCILRSISKPAIRQHIFKSHEEYCIKEKPTETLAYTCQYCKSSFWRVEERNDHQVKHHEDQIENFYKCLICQRVFSSKLCLNKHAQLDHPNQLSYPPLSFKCKLCLVLVPAIPLLKSHFEENHPTSLIFHCHRCNTTLKTKKTFRSHIKNVHSEERRRDCSLCGKVLWSKRAYAIHFRMKHSAQSKVGFRCRICQRRFDSKDERKLHYQIDHEGESPYHCLECGKGFASKSGMYGHRQLHTGSGISKCEYCGKEFTRKDSYNEHLLIHNGPRHKCPHCPKEFVQRSNLVRHIRIHTGEKPYKCLYCEKCFSDKGACNSHIRVHTREETCSCPYCGQTFSKKQKLKYHIRKHTGEGLINCEVCNKTFTNSFALKEHRVIHNRQTQILCHQCGKGFNSEKYLQRHVAIVHEPSKMFPCPLCPKVFSQQARLKAHLMTHTGVKHMKCLLCEKAYSVRKSLRRHLLEKHEVSPEHPQYKSCFYAMTVEEAGLLIPEGAGPFIAEDDSTSQSKDDDDNDEDYGKKKQPARKFPKRQPGRKGPSNRGVTKTSAPFEVYGSPEGEECAKKVDAKKPRRKYNAKRRKEEIDGSVKPATSSTRVLRKAYQKRSSRRITQKAAAAEKLKNNLGSQSDASEHHSHESEVEEEEELESKPNWKEPLIEIVTQNEKKHSLNLVSTGRKKLRVEAIVETLQKASCSPSSASPRGGDDEDGTETKPPSDSGEDDLPVLAKILPLNSTGKPRNTGALRRKRGLTVKPINKSDESS